MKNGTNGSLSSLLRKVWFPVLAFTLLASPIAGMWELLRPDSPAGIRVSRLLVVLIALFALAIISLVTEYFTVSRSLADASVANRRLQMVMMASGRSVGWEWDLASGRDYWYGDLRTMFGIPGDTWSGHTDEFFGYVHRDDRERVSQAVTDALQERALAVRQPAVVGVLIDEPGAPEAPVPGAGHPGAEMVAARSGGLDLGAIAVDRALFIPVGIELDAALLHQHGAVAAL